MLRVFVVACCVLLVFGWLGALSFVSASDFGEWSYRETLTFDYDGDFPFQLNFNVTYSSGMQVDFDDLRFTTIGNSLLGAWMEQKVDSDWCEVWVNVSSTSFFMYYGNDDAVGVWNSSEVFVDIIDDVVLALPMNEGSGSTVYDYSGNNFDGSINGAEWVEGGLYGSVLSFDGGSDVVDCVDNSSLLLNGEHSIFVLAYAYSYPHAEMDLLRKITSASSGNGYLYRVLLGGEMAVNWFSGWSDVLSNYTIGSGFDLDDWQFLVWSVNSSKGVSMYLNGSLVGDDVASDWVGDSSGMNLHIGNEEYGSSCWNGTLGGVFVFNSSLSTSQVASLSGYYPDSTLAEGFVLCRVWVDVMPSVVFSGTVEDLIEENYNELFGLGVVASVVLAGLFCGFFFLRRKK